MSDKELDFEFCYPQICVRGLLMDCDRTLLAWLDLLQLLLEYFLDAPLRIKRGEGRDFFFWFDRVSVDWVNAAWRPL